MYPRKRLDIGWVDLASAATFCVRRRDGEAARSRLESLWSDPERTLATLSVRSGLDLVLRCLALPPGSEVLVSAITIRDMVTIVEHHGLRAVPVDVDPETCAIDLEHLERAVTPRSRALLVAHLFGSRMPLEPIVAVARRHRLLLLEDCAQAFAADGYRGHPASDVAMFSFGPIKTATALGGALLSFRDAALCERVRRLEECLPVQSQAAYLRRVVKYSLLKALSYRLPYTVFVALCRRFGTTHDRIISASVRGFAGGELVRGIRHRPCPALLALLARRLRLYTPADLARRIAASTFVGERLAGLPVVGRRACEATHWVFPIESERPDRLVAHLWRRGFDATRGASSLYAVPAAGDRQSAAMAASRSMERLVYLPVDSGAGRAALMRLADEVRRFEAGG